MMAQRGIIEGINPARIVWCCEQVRLQLEDFAGQIKIPLKKLQNGSLTFNQLKKVARFFGYGVLFFLDEELPDKGNVLSPAFRSLTNQGVVLDVKMSKLIRNVEWHRDFYLSLMEESDSEHYFEKPKLKGKTADEKAIEIRNWLHLDGDNNQKKKTFETYRELFARKGIFTFLSTGYRGNWKIENDDFEGFSINHEKMPVIFVKKSFEKRQVFTLFHELAHLLLHDKKRAMMDSNENFRHNTAKRIEYEANEFAGKCLIPSETLEHIAAQTPENPRDYDAAFKDFSDKNCVSVEAVLVRLLMRRQISHEQYQQYRGIKKEEKIPQSSGQPKRYRHTEPAKIFGKHYVRSVLFALDEEQITLNKASNHLDKIKIEEFDKMRSHAFHH